MAFSDHLTNLKTRMHWLLSLDFSGTEYYFSEDNVGDVYSTDAVRYLKFRSGLQIYRGPTLAIDLASRTSSITTANLGIVGKYAIHAIRETTPLTNGEGELSLWVEGSDYDDRLKILIGKVRTPSWGEKEIPFKFTLMDSRWEKDRVFPPNHISKTNFPNAYDRYVGMPYPICYGEVYAVPCLCVDNVSVRDWMIAGHNVLSAPNADIYTNASAGTGGAPAALAITEADDPGGNGRYAYVQGDAAESDNVLGDFQGVHDAANNLIDNPAEIAEHIAENYSGLSSGEIADHARVIGQMEPYTASCIFNGMGSGGSTAFETIQRRLCAQFPLIARWRLGQWGVMHVDTVDPRPRGKLRVPRNLIRRTGTIVETPSEELGNKYEIIYQYDAYLNRFRAYKIIDSTNNHRCKVSENKYGLRQFRNRVLEFTDIQEEPTIDKIADWMTHAYSEIAIKPTYTATRDVLRYDPGDYVWVTDENMGWTDKVFLIEAMSPGVNETKVQLREST